MHYFGVSVGKLIDKLIVVEQSKLLARLVLQHLDIKDDLELLVA
jgi:hypothetical protein